MPVNPAEDEIGWNDDETVKRLNGGLQVRHRIVHRWLCQVRFKRERETQTPLFIRLARYLGFQFSGKIINIWISVIQINSNPLHEKPALVFTPINFNDYVFPSICYFCDEKLIFLPKVHVRTRRTRCRATRRFICIQLQQCCCQHIRRLTYYVIIKWTYALGSLKIYWSQ